MKPLKRNLTDGLSLNENNDLRLSLRVSFFENFPRMKILFLIGHLSLSRPLFREEDRRKVVSWVPTHETKMSEIMTPFDPLFIEKKRTNFHFSDIA